MWSALRRAVRLQSVCWMLQGCVSHAKENRPDSELALTRASKRTSKDSRYAKEHNTTAGSKCLFKSGYKNNRWNYICKTLILCDSEGCGIAIALCKGARLMCPANLLNVCVA
jgi:hypothetical protein